MDELNDRLGAGPAVDGYKFPEDLKQAEIEQFFPAFKPRLGNYVFEVALVLGGTVSAGAYTAGVLDYMMEALDAWQDAKAADEARGGEATVPNHKTVISVITGASGGAITGSIMARAAGWKFKHGANETNPFYRAWVEGITIDDLLSLTKPGPAAGEAPLPGLASLLDTSGIDRVARDVIQNDIVDENGQRSQMCRAYLANPLKLALTVGNLTGIPYAIPFTGVTGLKHEMHAHADCVRFSLEIPCGPTNDVHGQARPDEIPLHSYKSDNWDLLQDACLATSAFPVAFKCRELRRRMDALRYRAVVVTDEHNKPVVKALPLNWERLVSEGKFPEAYDFVNVDGGTIDNEPLELARQMLSGYTAHTERTGLDVHRATVLIDPFSDSERQGPSKGPDVVQAIAGLMSAWLQNARCKPTDIVLAHNDQIYSRYLVAPHRQGVVGQRALASGGLGGFLGFMDKSFVSHDFLLGRENARIFLETVFMLPENNPLFDTWPPKVRAKYQARAAASEKGYLPIIPLMDELFERPKADPAWPKSDFSAEAYRTKIVAKLDQIYDKVRQEHNTDLPANSLWGLLRPGRILAEMRQKQNQQPTGSWWGLIKQKGSDIGMDVYLNIGWASLKKIAANWIIRIIDGEVRNRGLRR